MGGVARYLSIVPPVTPKNLKFFSLGGGEEACGPQKMNRKLLGSQVLSERPGGDQPKARILNLKIQELQKGSVRRNSAKSIRAPMIRGVECLLKRTHWPARYRSFIEERRLADPSGRRSHAARTENAPALRSYLAQGRNLQDPQLTWSVVMRREGTE